MACRQIVEAAEVSPHCRASPPSNICLGYVTCVRALETGTDTLSQPGVSSATSSSLAPRRICPHKPCLLAPGSPEALWGCASSRSASNIFLSSVNAPWEPASAVPGEKQILLLVRPPLPSGSAAACEGQDCPGVCKWPKKQTAGGKPVF